VRVPTEDAHADIGLNASDKISVKIALLPLVKWKLNLCYVTNKNSCGAHDDRQNGGQIRGRTVERNSTDLHVSPSGEGIVTVKGM